MGGRGASSGTSKAGNHYGSQFVTVAKAGNVKIVRPRSGNTESLLETRTRGRVYGLMNSKGNVGSILYFDNDGKRSKRIDLGHYHRRMKPHTHHGRLGESLDGKKGASRLTPEEKAMVDRIRGL
ncbi:hypothetical protein M1L65_05935 [Slackia exigua]|uniref:hypothetical protein n=1 Tax=Slackia exigua TaxID=84109 RepID=UPI003B9E2D5A